MIATHTGLRPSTPTIHRTTVLSAALLFMVAGSQWGMLWLAGIYLEEGRSLAALSPEALMGTMAIAIAMATIPLFPDHPWRPRIDPAGWLLLAFLMVACVGELAQPDPRIRNLPTFISIGAYYMIGRSIGATIAIDAERVPATRGLLLVYTVWYFWILAFLISGDLGLHGLLPGTGIPRLQFREGFTATEIPILIGFQLPVLLCVLLSDRSTMVRIWSALLALCALAVVAASISAGAIVATMLTTIVFLLANSRRSGSKWILSTILILIAIVGVTAGAGGVFESIHDKLDEMMHGEGERGRIYAQLLADIAREPLTGVGRGRFVESHQLSWLGEGIYPHNNLLGIGAELGLPALFLFIAFALSACGLLAHRAFGSSTRVYPNIRLLAAMALAMFLYQQARGVLQDTWDAHETYVWLGIGIGAVLTFGQRRHAGRRLSS